LMMLSTGPPICCRAHFTHLQLALVLLNSISNLDLSDM
jgi:hypothetical protein